ncbi:MAG: DUF4267 domain-containing protein [Gluconacetobacter diazotrophicus]|nr:DUF4267 domain-containing protein [Gluconacetobacter diazotrophicus]
MNELATGSALLLALGIIGIGAGYLARPAAMTGSFGLPLPDPGPRTVPWLRLKGVRDLASGLLVLAFLACHRPAGAGAGLVLLVEAIVPVGDMLNILAARGSTRTALRVHGVTACLMLLVAVVLLMAGAR